MKQFLLLLTIFFPAFSYTQFAVVTDKDGYANVRSKMEVGNNITDTLHNGHLVYCLESQGNWTDIDYTKNKKELNAYIYKDRYTVISQYQAIPIVSKDDNAVKLGKGNIEVVITQKNFDRSRHTYKYYDNDKNVILLIDNKKYWGADGGFPTTEYRSITVKIGQKTIDLPRAALENLYEVTLPGSQVNFDADKNIIYIQSSNSDGAGGYEVIWKIEQGVYKERFVAHGF